MAAQYCVHYGDINYIAYHGYLAFTEMENKFNVLKEKIEKQQSYSKKRSKALDNLKMWAIEYAEEAWAEDTEEIKLTKMAEHVIVKLKRRVRDYRNDDPEWYDSLKAEIPKTTTVGRWFKSIDGLVPPYASKPGPTAK